MKNIVILGSTGSIGTSALEVVASFPEKFRVIGLTAGRNTTLLAEQIRRFSPEAVAVSQDSDLNSLNYELSVMGVSKTPELLSGPEGIVRIAEMDGSDMVLSAIVGAAGLLPTLAAVKKGIPVALANKETLVMAGELVMAEALRCGSSIIPVDSEHSAVFQCLRGYDYASLRRIILTASGGPFFGKTGSELKNVSAAQALKHPNWSMGRKISIDSATLMNKGLEVIEACRLFGLPSDKVDVLVHPQSIIHSIVEFLDGSCLAQMSVPDMKGPIALALSYPERNDGVMRPLSWETLPPLTFNKPDLETFRCLSLAFEALQIGGTMPAVLNAANEAAVTAFLKGDIGFHDIPAIIQKVMAAHAVVPADEISKILFADKWAREEAAGYC